MGGDAAGTSGVGEELDGLEDSVVVGVAFDLQSLYMLLNVGAVVLEKVVPPYVSIQSRVFQL